MLVVSLTAKHTQHTHTPSSTQICTIYVLSIQQFTVLYCNHFIDHRVEAQCEFTSDSSLTNVKHHPLNSGSAPAVSDC